VGNSKEAEGSTNQKRPFLHLYQGVGLAEVEAKKRMGGGGGEAWGNAE